MTDLLVGFQRDRAAARVANLGCGGACDLNGAGLHNDAINDNSVLRWGAHIAVARLTGITNGEDSRISFADAAHFKAGAIQAIRIILLAAKLLCLHQIRQDSGCHKQAEHKGE
jgi:hypothetical protein